MSNSSDDDVPLFQRNPAFMLGKQKAVVMSSDDDSPLPSWLENHKPAADDVTATNAADSSDSDIKEVISPIKLISPSKKKEISNHATTTTTTSQTQLAADKLDNDNDNNNDDNTEQQPKKKATPVQNKKQQISAPTIPSVSTSSIPIIIPDKLSQLKVLVELESKDEIHGATDLSGDSGAIGRIIINPSNKQVQVDLKGILYNATRVPTPMTMAVVNIGQTDGKVECVFNDFLQLREDARFTQVMGDGSTALFDNLLGADEDDDERYGAGGDDEKDGGDGVGGKKKRGGAAGGSGGRGRGRGGGASGGGVKRKATTAARKPRGGGVKKAAGKSKAKSKK